MKHLLLLFTLFYSFNAVADQLLPLPPAPPVAARAYLLADFPSGRLLVQEGINDRIEPASLTKLMTAYLTFTAIKQGRLKMNQVLPVSEKAWRTEGSRMFIEMNRPVTVDELIHGMIIQSGNDACISLAEGIAGSEEVFAQMMNQQAARLGMKNTHYMNSTGLPHPQHYTTAYDLSLLAAAIIRDFPEDFKYYSMKEYRYNNITQPNRNRLLWLDPSVDGMKTGHTESAGYCLIATAKRNPMRLISVVLGASSDNVRATESQKLLNYGFQFFDSHRVYAKGQTISNLPVWKGKEKTLKTGLSQDLLLTLPKGHYSRIKASVTSKQPLLAPISAGQAVGTLRLTLDDKPLAEYPLVALEEMPIANIFGRALDTIKLWFK
ncbi:MAG: D-alanyl-D-alanine carboxypeptidase family protein [Sulfurimicrobium sp.]|nr:D-alanyl-D-alanine carboxypeptidase family protein [Sulfurimicrobium sp.]MDP1704826.1 D-alanyl-D-alanine carboxypeptidase family protein [Sulfurimicrobium sp.]MDP2198543.1 D-alanyl-D-alanine carboxypeptidase family protein [Sulfurimicrobium sp.]MDP3687410.1 D-alanyl-D-alanine carboxypeptidase family protein [Sulfurimicrobium sp.]